jgi:hypothetical protein
MPNPERLVPLTRGQVAFRHLRGQTQSKTRSRKTELTWFLFARQSQGNRFFFGGRGLRVSAELAEGDGEIHSSEQGMRSSHIEESPWLQVPGLPEWLCCMGSCVDALLT